MLERLSRWAASVMLALLATACAGAECVPERATSVEIGAQTFHVEVAATPAQRERGLSGRAALGAGHGMWFVMPKPDLHGFWMRDMHFAIDLLWIDAGRRVLGVETLKPCVDKDCPIRRPPKPVTYVLEVEAGAFRGEPGMRVEWRCQAPLD
jgi:uncharacterized protein